MKVYRPRGTSANKQPYDTRSTGSFFVELVHCRLLHFGNELL